MKQKLTLLLIALFTTMGAWADVLPSAIVGTYAFQATALTTGASGHTITKDGNGNVTISPNNSGAFGATSGRFTCTLVVKINVPSTTTADVLCEMRQGSANTQYSQGLYMAADRKLKTSWGGSGRQTDANAKQLDAGEHTIIFTTGESGSVVYIDDTSNTLSDTGLKASGVSYKAIYIPAAYAQYVTEVHFYSSIQNATNITSIVTECSNHMHASQQAGTTASVASEKTLILDKAVNWTSLTGAGTVLQEVDINTTVAGNLPALTLKATAGTLTYTGSNLNGTTLDGVILGGSERITTSGTVNIKNLAGNNLTSSTNSYAFVGSGTLNFYGTCDLTKKSDGSATTYSKLGYGSNASINIKEDANVTTTAVLNTVTSSNNAPVIVESNATLGGEYVYGKVTLGEGSNTTLSNSNPFNLGTVTVSGDATLNLTATPASLSQAITVADSKTLTIDCASNTVNLSVVPSMGSGSKINFQNATINYNNSVRNLADYTFTSSTAQFVESGDEYKAGGFTITNISDGVTVKVKKYDATSYETVTPEAGTATISHEVGVSGLAAWLDYTFNESTKATNIHSPADQVITNAGNAGSGNNLTIDTGYNTDNSYNEDGTLKVMSTPWRNITWPTNYTVAVAGNVPDVENGCLVAFGSTTTGSKNYLAIIRGASQNEIKLVKGHDMNNAFEVISTMTAANATALSHLVVFTKNGNTFTVYLDGVQKTQVTYSDALGGGFQIGSLHGGVTGTGVGRVNDMSDATKAKVFAKAIRVYDYVISPDQMEALTEEFPYTSFGGKYSRTITANSNLSATDAWLNASTQGNVDVPVNAIVDEVTYYPDVEITTTAASTLTVNANMDVENIKFDGAGKLTIASDGEHNIHIYGSLTANGPISVKYGETDLSAVPVTIGESGSVEFDFSASDFSSVNAPTDYPVTGNTADYGSKVTGVYPSDIYHTYTLAHNGSSNSYVLTVAPSVALKQQQAVALVAPYESFIGTGLGKYTITLGETSYTSFDDFEDAVEAWSEIEDCVVPTIAINQPTSAFYRFHIGSNYMCSDADNAHIRTVTETSDGANTIFYLNANNYLIDYTSGFGFNYGYCKATEAGIFNSFDFPASETKGSYLIHSNAGTGDSQWSDRYITISESKLGEGQGAWTIEPVESLPIRMNEVDNKYYGTINLPVAVTIPKGVYAYKAAVAGNVMTLTKVVENGVLAANTPVVLYSESQVTELAISGDSGTSVTGNKLSGTVAAEAVTAGDNYVLSSGSKGVGFYKYTGTTMPGFKAYLPASAGGGVKAFSFSFEDMETAIRAIENENSGLEIYDISGRRVPQAGKGLYIVNGKKVMFK